MKFTFSTDYNKPSQNMGIADERHNLFFETAKETSTLSIMRDKSITKKSQAMEIFLNKAQPQNIVEAFWAGCVFENVFSQTEKIAEEMLKLLRIIE